MIFQDLPPLLLPSISGGLARDFKEFYGIRKGFDGVIPTMVSLAPLFGEMPSTLSGINLFGALKIFEDNFLPENTILENSRAINCLKVNDILITANDFGNSSGVFLVKRYNGQ